MPSIPPWRVLEKLSGPLNQLNAILSLLQPLDRYTEKRTKISKILREWGREVGAAKHLGRTQEVPSRILARFGET